MCSQLDFDEAIRTIFQMNDGITFQIRLISVMEHLSIKNLTIDSEVSDA